MQNCMQFWPQSAKGLKAGPISALPAHVDITQLPGSIVSNLVWNELAGNGMGKINCIPYFPLATM